ncbi:Hypothetical protein NTJ_04898 [Nesidiocoris tenuis]|nr:Hypothetical protein NTJ_04898 [Nesidiocoris tenuis]
MKATVVYANLWFSWWWMILVELQLADSRIFNACEITNEILSMKVNMAGKSRPLNCNNRHVAQIVCAAGLHSFDTSFRAPTKENDFAIGLFGIPSKYVELNCKNGNLTENFADHLNCMTSFQFSLRRQKRILVSEVICESFADTTSKYPEIKNGIIKVEQESVDLAWKKKIIKCKELNWKVYAMRDSLRSAYQNVVATSLPDVTNSTVCKEIAYCMRTCLQGNPDIYDDKEDPWMHERTYRGKNERKVDRLAKVVDATIVCLWSAVVVGCLVLAYLYVKYPRRRATIRGDDWGRPILTEQFSL